LIEVSHDRSLLYQITQNPSNPVRLTKDELRDVLTEIERRVGLGEVQEQCYQQIVSTLNQFNGEEIMTNTFPWLLFHPNIPKPLHGLAPRIILGEKWWNETKKAAKAKLNYHCWACGIHQSQAKYHQWLEAHECYSINYNLGRVEYVGTCALCHACHNYIHDGRMLIMVEQGELDIEKYEAIIEHGETVLKRWFKAKGWQWQGYKEAYLPMKLYSDIYPTLPIFSQKIQWVDGDCEWEDYHLIVEGKRYEIKHKSPEDWRNHYQTKGEKSWTTSANEKPKPYKTKPITTHYYQTDSRTALLVKARLTNC
jgi:hypothetical protein